MTPFNEMLLLILLASSVIHCLELCTFDEGTCEWDIKPPWNVVSLAILPRRQVPGFLITSKTPDVITSEGPFLLAQGKFAAVPSSRVTSQKISKSDHMRILAYRYQRRGRATLRILLKNQTDEVLLDTISPNELERTKWHRRSVIFPPIPSDDQTSVIFECDNIQTADFVAFSSIDLVDENSKTLTCDQVASPNQPHSGNFVRLTALQNLKMSPIESLMYQPPISTTTPFFPILPPSISFNIDEKPVTAPVAVLPISPAHVSARGVPIVPVTSFSNPLIPLSIPKFPF